MENRPKVGIGVLIIKDNKILFGKRKNSHGDGTWAPPGGHIEWMESFEECAKREVMEETGLEIKDIKFATVTNDMFKNENKHYITIFITCKIASGSPKIMEPNKCEKWEWFSWNELPNPIFLAIENLRLSGFSPLK